MGGRRRPRRRHAGTRTQRSGAGPARSEGCHPFRARLPTRAGRRRERGQRVDGDATHALDAVDRQRDFGAAPPREAGEGSRRNGRTPGAAPRLRRDRLRSSGASAGVQLCSAKRAPREPPGSTPAPRTGSALPRWSRDGPGAQRRPHATRNDGPEAIEGLGGDHGRHHASSCRAMALQTASGTRRPVLRTTRRSASRTPDLVDEIGRARLAAGGDRRASLGPTVARRARNPPRASCCARRPSGSRTFPVERSVVSPRASGHR